MLLVVQFGLLVHVNRSPHDETCNGSALAARLETLSLASTALSLILSLIQTALDPVDPHWAIELLQYIVNLAFVFVCLAVLVGEVWEETGHPDRVPPKKNRPGELLMAPFWVNLATSTKVVPVEQDDYQVSMLKRAIKLREENDNKAKLARAAATVHEGNKLGAALDERRKAPHEESRDTSAKQLSQSEEIMYIAKEKDLNAEMEKLRSELDKVRKREKLSGAVHLLGKGAAKPQTPSTPACLWLIDVNAAAILEV